MAGKAIMRRIVTPMASDAKAHVEALMKDNAVHRFHVAVAVAAIHAGSEVHAMVEMNEVRQVGDPNPKNRLTILVVPANLLDLRVMDDDPAVTEHARLDRRNSRHRPAPGIRVAHQATDFLASRVDTMTE